MRSCHAGINFWEIYLVDQDTFQDNPFCSLIITDTKLDNPKRHKKNKGLLSNDQHIEGVASDLLHMVQTVKYEGVNFEENSHRQLPIFKLLSQLHSNQMVPFIYFATFYRAKTSLFSRKLSRN